jgi:hypothetical protein
MFFFIDHVIKDEPVFLEKCSLLDKKTKFSFFFTYWRIFLYAPRIIAAGGLDVKSSKISLEIESVPCPNLIRNFLGISKGISGFFSALVPKAAAQKYQKMQNVIYTLQ